VQFSIPYNIKIESQIKERVTSHQVSIKMNQNLFDFVLANHSKASSKSLGKDRLRQYKKHSHYRKSKYKRSRSRNHRRK